MNAVAETTPRENAERAISELGLSIRAEFVPFRHSRNAKEKMKSLNWFVTVEHKGRAVLRTDYMAGQAHCPAYSAKGLGPRDCVMRATAISEECERGVSHGKKILPDTLDVFYSLVMDASVLDSGSFESWAGDFGYDTDSRSAEATYRACLDTALKLRAVIGDEGLRTLQTAFEGY